MQVLGKSKFRKVLPQNPGSRCHHIKNGGSIWIMTNPYYKKWWFINLPIKHGGWTFRKILTSNLKKWWFPTRKLLFPEKGAPHFEFVKCYVSCVKTKVIFKETTLFLFSSHQKVPLDASPKKQWLRGAKAGTISQGWTTQIETSAVERVEKHWNIRGVSRLRIATFGWNTPRCWYDIWKPREGWCWTPLEVEFGFEGTLLQAELWFMVWSNNYFPTKEMVFLTHEWWGFSPKNLYDCFTGTRIFTNILDLFGAAFRRKPTNQPAVTWEGEMEGAMLGQCHVFELEKDMKSHLQLVLNLWSTGTGDFICSID